MSNLTSHLKSPIISLLLNAAKDDIHRLHAHPFNMGLRRGNLPFEYFNKFLISDKRYLLVFSKVLKKIALRYQQHDVLTANKIHAISTYIAQTEVNLLNKYSNSHERNYFFSKNSQKNNVIESYLSHLSYICSYEPLIVSVGGIASCFLIYNLEGYFMQSSIKDTNLYSLWIRSYSSKTFTRHTQTLIDVIENYEYDDETLRLTTEAFVKSTRYELLFLDSIYQGCSEEASTNIMLK